ncbi:MAG: hypothetical protein ACOYNY_36240 [Caldilineaceae bacterium]|jgi:hypothetical protein
MKWPSYFPNHCPPEDAKPAVATVYMLVSSPLSPLDFRPLHEREPGQQFSSPDLLCQAHGLSVFEEIQDVDRVRRRVKRLRQQIIAQGQLTQEIGVIKPTSSRFGHSHRTWWVAEGVKAWLYFRVVESEER